MRQAPCPFYKTVQTPGIYLCEEAVVWVAKNIRNTPDSIISSCASTLPCLRLTVDKGKALEQITLKFDRFNSGVKRFGQFLFYGNHSEMSLNDRTKCLTLKRRV